MTKAAPPGRLIDMTNTNELPAVARNINLPCKKCETDRFFVVMAHTTPTSAKVKCEVCGATKTYKLPSAKKAASPRKKSAPVVDTSKVWNEMREKFGDENIVNYTMKTKFVLNSAVQHPKFGLGFVTLVTNEKIDVAFQEGLRSLVHNRP